MIAALLAGRDPREGWQGPRRRRIVEILMRLELFPVTPHSVYVDIWAIVRRDHAVSLRFWAVGPEARAVFTEPARAVVVDAEGDVVQGERVVDR
jgi:hypothetical protein